VCALWFLVHPAGPRAAAQADRGRADLLCDRAERAERDAREAERRSQERRRFLQGQGGAALQGSTAAAGTAAQAIRAGAAQARATLPLIRQAAAAVRQDRVIAPGLAPYFTEMEGVLAAGLEAAEGCLAAPERCAPPALFCPAPPPVPVFDRKVASADTIRQIQADYRRAADMAYRACLDLKNGLGQELERLRAGRGGTGMGGWAGSGAAGGRAGEVDLYLRRAESLRREASRLRLEADAASGVRGYCQGRRAAVPPRDAAGDLAAALRGAKKDTREAGLSLGAKVVDLKAAWQRSWSKGPSLVAADVPLPRAEVRGGPDSLFGRVDQFLEASLPGYGKARDYVAEKAPWWWYRARSAWRDANEQVELGEFIASRPAALAEDVVTSLVEDSFGRFGKSLTTAYKITKAVRNTSKEVGAILEDAPLVLAHGGVEDARELYRRTGDVPLKFAGDLFDDVTGKIPAPRERYDYIRAPEAGDGR